MTPISAPPASLVPSLFTLAWACLAGCQAGPAMQFEAEPLDVLHTVTPIPVPASLALEATKPIGDPIRIGDSAVYSLQLESAEATQTWFLRLTVIENQPGASGNLRYTLQSGEELRFTLEGAIRFYVQVADVTGAILSSSRTPKTASEPLNSGFADGCISWRQFAGLSEAESARLVMQLPRHEQKHVAMTILTAQAILDIIQQNKSLAPLLEKVVRKPSLLQVITNMTRGIVASFEFEKARAWQGATPVDVETAFVVPVGLQAFGNAALEASMIVARSKQPLHACAGILSIAGVHPDNRETQVHMQLQSLGWIDATQLGTLLLETRKQ